MLALFPLASLKDPVARSFAIRLTLASALAMALASMLALTNPWWAAMAVWMVSQPTRGLLIERGIAQLLGTCVGGLVAVGLMTLLGGTPWLLLPALGVWVALCCGAGNVMRHQRAYGAVLCGLTTVVIVVLSTGTDIVPAEFAMARVLDGAIGILSSILLVALPNPRSRGEALLGSARGVTATAILFAAQTLVRHDRVETLALERRVLGDMASLDASSEDGAAGSLVLRRRLKFLRGLLASLLDLVSISRTVRMRLGAAGVGEEAARELGAALREVSEDVAGGRSPKLARIHDRMAVLQAATPSLHHPLLELGQTLDALLADYREMSSAGPQAPQGEALFHPDLASARRAMVRGLMAACAAGAFWLSTEWEPARYLMLGTCVFTTLFASADEPTVIVRRIFEGAVAGCIMALLWRAVAVHYLDNAYLSLLLAMPFMFMAGVFQAGRATSLIGLAFNMIFAVIGQPIRLGVTPPAELVVTELALLAGIAVSYAAYRWLMPMSTVHKREHLKGSILTEIAGMAIHAGGPKARRHWARMRTLALGLTARSGGTVATAEGVLAALSTGHAVLRIGEILQGDVPRAVGERVQAALVSLRQPGRSAAEMSAALTHAATDIDLGAASPPQVAELVRSLREAAFCMAAQPAFFTRAT